MISLNSLANDCCCHNGVVYLCFLSLSDLEERKHQIWGCSLVIMARKGLQCATSLHFCELLNHTDGNILMVV